MKSLRIGLSGPDLFAVLGSLPDRLVPPGLSSELSVDDQPGEARERWPADMRRCDLSAMAHRPGPAHHQDGSFLSLDKGELVVSTPSASSAPWTCCGRSPAHPSGRRPSPACTTRTAGRAPSPGRGT
ncbi:hypothetical protein ACFFV7_35950 [Nonomuraea spiralis]|uniref:Uncharacterized protein n=1 Tax=Nonomuraea spiralis TaxID=46182 RepID=A0ABV5IRJ9_9ACTN|nr:hypothetical protein [Nonomuraea spiralis]GGT11376.1 hypothetical protein GCM10010176_065030 [Nonomuraea spiralis]